MEWIRYINLNKKIVIGAGIFLFVAVSVTIYFVGDDEQEETIPLSEYTYEPAGIAADSRTSAESVRSDSVIEDQSSVSPERKEESVKVIVVDIKGAVMEPGVYELSRSSRVHEGIALAGGFTEDADRSRVNLAQHLEDGVILYIPSLNETESQSEETSSSQENLSPGINHTSSLIPSTSGGHSGNDGGTSPVKVNINTATVTELQTVKGIGPSIAQKIIDYRESRGSFQKIEDLLLVKGIGEKTLEKWKAHLVAE